MQPWPWIRRISWWKSHGENDGKTSGWEVVKSTSTAIKAPEGKRPGLRSWHMSKKTFEEKYLLFFSERMLVHRFMLAPFLWTLMWNVCNGFDGFDGFGFDMRERCRRCVLECIPGLISSWFMLIYVDLCPGGFQHKSWRLHHDEIILAVAQEERDSLGSSRVHFCRCVRLVSGAGTSCTWNEMMWTTCFSTFGPSIQEDCGISTYFRKPREPSWYVCISGLSETVLYSTLQSADLRNPCKPYLSKTSKMMLQLIPPHVLFIYSSFILLHLGGSFTSTESRHCRCQIIVLQGHDATNRTRLIASGEPREIGNRQGRFWNSSLTILLFDSLSR